MYMDKVMGRKAPDYITELSKCEVFVFGSNLEGRHAGGAARLAYEKFGAEWGKGVGPQGQCYAIPTMQGPISTIKPYVDDFIDYAKRHPMNRFLLTRIGCGIAGFKDKEMAPLFVEAMKLPNVCFPIEWYINLLDYAYPHDEDRQTPPPVINMQVLERLCEENLYVIGAGLRWTLPDIRIRYVIDEDKFGYKDMGDFFFFLDCLYVFDRDEIWAEDHNKDLVDEIFYDECKGHGYAHRVLFAGVRTPYKDSKGDYIYTGDVCHIKLPSGAEYDFALSTLGSEENKEFFSYAFVLDNHCIHPEECESITRVGTVFYMLDKNDHGDLADELSRKFIGGMGCPYTMEQRLLMATFTPSFHKKDWEYVALKELDIEYNWRGK